MDICKILWENAKGDAHRGLPILSFPAVQKMDAKVCDLVKSSELQAQAMEIMSSWEPTKLPSKLPHIRATPSSSPSETNPQSETAGP